MVIIADQTPIRKKANDLKLLYKRNLQGAIIRSGASFIMWLSCLIAYLIGLIHLDNFISDSIAVSYLILMNPPALWVLKRIDNRRLAKYFSLFINILEIIGYTAVIHSLGGIEAVYLMPIYSALIIYTGIMGPRSMPFIIAALCSVSFSIMLVLEHVGILRVLKINPLYHVPWSSQLGIIFVDAILLFVVAFISSYTALLLKSHRDKLRRQNEELQVVAVKASESDRLKSEFLANVSHELRTPLNAIIGFSELLKDQYLGVLNEKQMESACNINTSGKHLLSIVSDLLDLGSVEAGKMELEVSETNFKILVENSLNVVGRTAHERRIQLSAETGDCPEMIRVDERKITQILYNLLSNAIKFTPEGGSVKLLACHLTWINNHWLKKSGEIISLPLLHGDERKKHDRVVEISVTDSGIGLKAEDMERIFSPFVQVDGSKSRRYQGVGLGLSLTKRLVELHGGTIWAESKGENKGSSFHVVIPI
ncbi:hypothetical protein D4R89_10170 [bacterium]|nr:MAG: hypothetical protein D4R89_10170 [bacterium]